MGKPEASQVDTAPDRRPEPITVMEAAQPASPLDLEVFYNLLADILKRLVSEEAEPSVERKVG